MNQLEVLFQSRNALLLAETIGWLHDYRKCTDEFLINGLPNSELLQRIPGLSGVSLSFPGLFSGESIDQLLNHFKSEAKKGTVSALSQYLYRCHNTAHFDKQEPVGGVPKPGTFQASSPFGFGYDIPTGLTAGLWRLPWSTLTGYSVPSREGFQKDLIALFPHTVADTRHPINEIDLWSWGSLVGALYKAALAHVLLIGQPVIARDLRWRLLGIRVNGLEFLLNIARIPDLLAKQYLLSDGLDRVRALLEVTYPLGSEVYRDENGSIYVVPDIPDLLSRTDNRGASLRSLILGEFAKGTSKNDPGLQLRGEVTPHIELGQSWWGQDPDWHNKTINQQSVLYGKTVNDKLPEIGKLISQRVVSLPDLEEVARSWQSGKITDICTVCGLRPQGPGGKAESRNVCVICEERRADRSKQWATSESNKTIWTDEVADANGRLALIVGEFDLEPWLDGAFTESLFVVAPPEVSGKPVTSKTASFSRLRRIWETTRRFWREIQAQTLQQLADDRRRLKIRLAPTPKLGPYHVYDLDLGPADVSVVWVPDGQYLISADNLGYIVKQLKADAAISSRTEAAEDHLQRLLKDNPQPALYNPDIHARRGRSNLLSGIRVADVTYEQDRYATATPIISEPRTFMILIPADKSLAVLRQIKAKYELEMGKVRDRLPIHLGAVYANRRTPVRALLYAGQKMLRYHRPEQQWTIRSIPVKNQDQKIQKDNSHFNETILLQLERGTLEIEWRIPLKLGDGSTEDCWYPYMFLETDGDDARADAANRRAVKIPVDNNDPVGKRWVVHVADLRCGEKILIRPSTFDFEFLDTTSRRFEIWHDENGRRPRNTRPFYLEDMDRLDRLWERMQALKPSQRRQALYAIESTREEWYGANQDALSNSDEVFSQFVSDTLSGANWPRESNWSSIPKEWQGKLIRAGVRGELADLAELRMEILREG